VGRYRIVEDIALADSAFDVEGRDLADLFETAALALAELMVDPATVARTTRHTIALEAAEIDLLLYDWLSELIFRKDRDGEVYTHSTVGIEGDGPFHLKAEVEGGTLDPARVELRADPKAVTFHQFALERSDGGWRARIVIDV
jgi:SHS2 domain-containing protein